jgi:hypothetical protein
VLLAIWTLLCVVGVVAGIDTGSAGIAIFYLVAYVVILGAGWLVADWWERGEAKRDAQKQARVERRIAGRAERERRHQEAEARREQQERDRITAAKERDEARRAETERIAAERAEAQRQAAMTITLTREESRLVEAEMLRLRLETGEVPTALDARGLVLNEGETLIVRAPAQLWEFRGETVQYLRGGALLFGNPLFLAGSLAASAAVSAASRHHARKAAAAQWRAVDAGELLLSNQRMTFKGSNGWHEMPFASLRAVDCELDALAVQIVDGRPLRISLDAPESVFILLNCVAWHRLPETHLPEELVQRMESSETIVFADGRGVASETLRGEDAAMRDRPGIQRAAVTARP